MGLHRSSPRAPAAFTVLVLSALAATAVSRLLEPSAQEPPTGFGGAYSALDERRQALVADWVARFNDVTGQDVEPGPFYDDFVKLSVKTTFEAVTNALMTTPLTDASGGRQGDALDLVERVESVRGQVLGAGGDRQFRMYAFLKSGARDLLERSQEFAGAPTTPFTTEAIRSTTASRAGPPRSRSPCPWTAGAPISTSTTGRRGSPPRSSTGT